MISMKRVFSCFLVILLSSGCATGYHRQGFAGGYDESQLKADIFRVTFKGNAFISPEKVQDYLLLRCAELTIDNGFSYFIILSESDGMDVSGYTMPTEVSSRSSTSGRGDFSADIYSYSPSMATVEGTGRYSGRTTTQTTITGGQTYYYSKPRSTVFIKCFKEKPSEFPDAFVAYETIGFLKNKVR